MYIADLHIHSKYSRATSRDCDAAHLDLWARYKGIGLVGTGDFTHPAWREELQQNLEPAEEGLYKLRKEYRLEAALAGAPREPRFVISGEISSIYKKNGKTRKVHNLILLPSLEDAEILSRKLEAIGNIHSDGRPILGLDSRDLLEITLESCPQAIFIPAHIWTPHFSLFGAFSGFDTIEECFEDLTPHIHALETGLSSDPPMNWRVSALDRFVLVSNSDAHSPAKLGREANLLDCDLSYPALAGALQSGAGFAGTVEFFPEEGKYHLDGHRNCKQCLEPQESKALDGRCPVCGKKLTIGVLHRVEDLADRPTGFCPPAAKPFESLAPLPEVLAAATGLSPASKKNQERYFRLLHDLGPEFYILRQAPLAEIESVAGQWVAEGIRRLRAGQVMRQAGYDGEYGKISLFDTAEMERLRGEQTLFDLPPLEKATRKTPVARKKAKQTAEEARMAQQNPPSEERNEQQAAAVAAREPVLAVIAGPGTGKTSTLVARIAALIENGVKPAEITAVTFTNQAASQMRERLAKRLGSKKALRGLTVGTFHAICLQLLEPKPLLGENETLALLRELLAQYPAAKGLTPSKLRQKISQVKNGQSCEQAGLDAELYAAYCQRLAQTNARDLDDLLLEALQQQPAQRRMFRHLLVDEFQDINAVQRRLIRHWHSMGETLFVIGDPDQSIYGFRGANAHCFAELATDFPQLRTIHLEQNYRSTPEILAGALALINHNPGETRHLRAMREAGASIRLVKAATPFAEAVWIAKEISRMAGGVDMLQAQTLGHDHGAVRSFAEIAVLCRSHRQLELVETCLRHDGIPCLVLGREDYLQEDAVQAALGFFGSLLEPRNTNALRLALRLAWQCPADAVDWAAEHWPQLAAEAEPAARQAAFGGFGPLAPWLAEVERYLPRREKEKPLKLLQSWAADHGSNAALERLLNMAVFYKDMPELLQNLALGQEADLRRASGKGYAAGAVRLLTLHGAKGLEFPVVFLAGLTAGSMPLERKDSPVDMEEERRLLFVGMTRAQEELVLTTAEQPSAFLAELPPQSIQCETLENRKKQPTMEQLTLF